MTIAELFSYALDTPTSPLYTRDRDDFTVARNSIRAFLEHRGQNPETTDILAFLIPGWTAQYLDFLLEKYRANKPRGNRERTPEEKRKWALRYLKCLRKVINTCIRQGLLPNVDCFAEIPDFARRQGVEEPDSVAEVIQGLASRGVPIVKGRHSFHLSDLYLLALYCGGLEIGELLALTPASAQSLASRVALPENILATLGEFLHSPLAEKASPRHVAWLMETERLRLFRARSVFTDWLRYAAERHLDEITVRRIAALRLEGTKTPPHDLQLAMQRVADGLAANCNRYRKLWYCLVTSRKCAAERFEELAALSSPSQETPLIPFFADRRKDFYFLPPEKATRKRGQRAAAVTVLKRYLFACLYPHETDVILDRMENVRFLRSGKGARTLAVIPPAELYKLQLMLQSLDGTGATLTLEDDDVRAAIDTTPLPLRQKVRIAKPGYESYEAEIIKAGPADRYSVRFPHLNLSFILTDIPRALITKI